MKLTVKNGSYAYPKADPLWENVDLSVKSGEILAIMGPNGVGKTTLLKCIMNLLPWKTGNVFIDGQPTEKISYREFWQKIGYVPQAKTVTQAFSVKDFVLMGRNAFLGSFGKPGKADEKKAEEVMDLTGVLDLQNKSCRQLSGGQFQMVLIARALCSEPRCLILDEPESNLDFRNQLLVLDLMKRLAKELDIACLFNTHYPEHGLRVADQALLVYKEEPVLFGKTEQIVTEKNLERLFQVKVHMGKNDHVLGSYQTVTALEIM